MRTSILIGIALAATVAHAQPARAQAGKVRPIVDQYLREKGILDADGNYSGGGGGGVTSVAGTTNQVSVSGATGDVTFSLPQDIATSSTPTFRTVTLTNNAANNSSLLTLTKNPSGSQSGDAISVTMGTNATGALLNAAIQNANVPISILRASDSYKIFFVDSLNNVGVAYFGGSVRSTAETGGSAPVWVHDNSGNFYILGGIGFRKSSDGSMDLGISRQTTGTLGIYNFGSTTTSAALRVYNTTDAVNGSAPTNAEWIEAAWSGNVCTIKTAKAGTGTVRSLLVSGSGANGKVYFGSATARTALEDYAISLNDDCYIGRNGATGSFYFGSSYGDTSPSNSKITVTTLSLLGTNTSIDRFHNVVTTGWQLPGIYGSGEITGQTTNANIATYTAGAADGDFEVSATVNITAATSVSTAIQVTYTDKANNARTTTLPVQLSGGTGGTYLANGLLTATGDYSTPTTMIRVKASTAITLRTASGTFTGVTYSASGCIKQVR